MENVDVDILRALNQHFVHYGQFFHLIMTCKKFFEVYKKTFFRVVEKSSGYIFVTICDPKKKREDFNRYIYVDHINTDSKLLVVGNYPIFIYQNNERIWNESKKSLYFETFYTKEEIESLGITKKSENDDEYEDFRNDFLMEVAKMRAALNSSEINYCHFRLNFI